jgi:probable F420-dependent oxidoreductase
MTAPLTLGYQPALAGPDATPDRIRSLATRAESAGFTRLSVIDHVVLPIDPVSQYPYGSGTGAIDNDWWDPFVVLGLWAGLTTRVRLQTSVLVLPYRPPILTAKILASLDAITGGRLEVGVGSGWLREEFEVLGSPPFDDRGRVTDEYVAAFRELWSAPFPRFAGTFVAFDGITMHPKPAQDGGIPILVGGTTAPALRRAALLGDGWQPLKITPADLTAGVASIRARAAAAGRTLPDDYQVSVRYGVRVTDGVDERRPAEDPDRVLVGDADTVERGLRELAAAGATDVMLDTRTSTAAEVDRMLEVFEQRIIPRLADG